MKARHEFESKQDWLDYYKYYTAAMEKDTTSEWSVSTLELLVGEKQPAANTIDIVEWYFKAAAKLKVMAADALIAALNTTPSQ